MRAHLPRLFHGTPLLAGVGEVAEEFLLLRIDGDHRPSVREATLHSRVDVPKLRVAVRMVPPRLRLPVALETVVEPVQELGHLRMADRMVSSTEFVRDRPRTLTNPPQGRFRIAPRLMIDHRFQGIHEPRVRHRNGFAPSSRAADPACQQRGTLLDVTYPVGDRQPRQAAGTMDKTHTTIAHRHRLAGRHEAPRAFVQQGPHRLELCRQLSKTAHTQAHSSLYHELISFFIYEA